MLVSGARAAQVVYALAELGVADELADGPRTVAEIAAATGTHEPSLARLLRAAAAIDVIAALPDGRYGPNALSAALRSDAPGSVRELVLFNASDLDSLPWRALSDGIRTGKPTFDTLFGTSFFAHLDSHPEDAALFDRAMTNMSVSSSAVYLAQYDFSDLTRVADVGGGRGYFLSALLQRYPHLHGVLVDLPGAAAEAPDLLRERGLADRVSVEAGDFFTEVPGGCDGYVIKNVLHDWDDDDALRILRTVRAAMAPDSRILICESVLAPPGRFDHAALLDLDMMLKFGGRERDLESWRSLLARAGLRLANNPTVGARTVLDCRLA
jgi:multifunctional cyclase/dehydratase/O-methyltransferase